MDTDKKEERELPEGWLITTVGDTCSILDSKRIPLNSGERNRRIEGKAKDELFPYYGATGEAGKIDDYLFDGEYVLLGEDAAPFLEPHKGVAYMVNGKFWVNNHAHIISLSSSNKFLCYCLTQTNYAPYITGTTRLKLNQAKLKEIPLPLPPLAEQKRIVIKIEELFSELDAGEENFKQARKQLGIYRQSLLKQAFEGKLTEAWKTRKIKPFGELIGSIQQGWSPKCNLDRPPEKGEWAIIKTTAIQPMRYNDIEAKPLPSNFKPREHIEIKDGDFLMTRKGPRYRAGVTCYVPKTRTHSMVCDTVYRFRCDETVVDPLYLEIALNTPQVTKEIDSLKAGISESGLSLTHSKVKSVSIPICSLPDQKEIVRILEAQFTVIEQNEREIDAALKRCSALRQSILKKAFSGQLVPQNPDDEPASELLARIQTERTAQKALAKNTVRKKVASKRI